MFGICLSTDRWFGTAKDGIDVALLIIVIVSSFLLRHRGWNDSFRCGLGVDEVLPTPSIGIQLSISSTRTRIDIEATRTETRGLDRERPIIGLAFMEDLADRRFPK